MEIWKDVKGYEGMYQISNIGRIKSLTRSIKNSNNSNYMSKERILKQFKTETGYLKVSLSKNGVVKPKKIHQLVAIAFLNHTPNGHNGLIVDHIDNNKENNRVDNLQLVTQRYNASKDIKKKTSKYTGVSWDKSRCKWQSCIQINGVSKHLGRYTKEEDASKAYQKALFLYHNSLN